MNTQSDHYDQLQSLSSMNLHPLTFTVGGVTGSIPSVDGVGVESSLVTEAGIDAVCMTSGFLAIFDLVSRVCIVDSVATTSGFGGRARLILDLVNRCGGGVSLISLSSSLSSLLVAAAAGLSLSVGCGKPAVLAVPS